MKTLHTTLPVQFKFFGKPEPKAFETQSFDTKLEEFREKAYASLTENNDFTRACLLIDGRILCLIDRGIDAIRTLLKNVWNTPEKLVYVRLPSIHVFMQVDNNYTAYSVTVSLCHGCIEKFETSKSSNFVEVVQAEKDEVLKKHGFTAINPEMPGL